MAKKSKRKQAFENRATLQEDNPTEPCDYCEYCGDPILFHLRDNYHEFSIGLNTILSCLALAEKEGYVPKIDIDWWFVVGKRYNVSHGAIYAGRLPY